jgi:hypothetical protein
MKTKIPVDDPQPNLIRAIEDGEVDGDVYSDGEVWVDPQSWWRWLPPELRPKGDLQ